MAAEKTLVQLYKEHVAAFTKHLKKARGLDEKQIHKLRVEIKNIRVLIEFLKILSKKKPRNNSILKILKPIFKKAGKIRSHQMNLEQVRHFRTAVMQRFKKHLLEGNEKAGKELIKELKIFDKKGFRKFYKKHIGAFKKLKHETILKGAEAHLRKIMTNVRTELFDMSQDEVLHEIRKHLKTTRNIMRLISEIDADPPKNSALKKLNDTYEEIGAWHDGVELAGEFEKYLTEQESQVVQEKTLATLLKLREKNEKNKLLVSKKLRLNLA